MNNASNKAVKLGKKIRLARINKGLKQYELAEHCNVTANYISLIEAGKKTPSLRTISNIAKALDVNVSNLLDDDPIIEDIKDIAKKYDIDALLEGLLKMKKQTTV